MSSTPTLPRIPTGPLPTPPGVRRNRRIALIVALVAVVIVAALAVAWAAGWFDTGDTQTPIVEPDGTAPDLPEDVTPDDTDVTPDPTDDVAPDRPDGATTTPRYGEEPRANWDVTGVAADDVLNVRNGPGTTSPVVATLAHDAAEFESTGRIAQVGDQLWREIVVPGDGVGWVNAAYLTETG